MNKQRADFKERLEQHIRNLEETSNNEGSHDLACRCADSLRIIRELQTDIAALSQQNHIEDNSAIRNAALEDAALLSAACDKRATPRGIACAIREMKGSL